MTTRLNRLAGARHGASRGVRRRLCRSGAIATCVGVVAALSGCGAGSRAAGEPSVVAHWLAAINTQRWAEACALMTRSAQSEDGSSCIDSLKRSVAGAKVRYLRKETVTYIFGTADRATIYVFATMRGNKAIGRGGVVLTRKPGLQFIAAAIYTGSYL